MEFNPELATVVAAKIAIENLTDKELVALNLAIKFNNPNIKTIMGYEKVSELFTENNGTKVHSLVEQAFDIVVLKRLGG